jgi:hypothetical protein
VPPLIGKDLGRVYNFRQIAIREVV